MKTRNQKMALAMAVGLVASPLTIGKPQAATAPSAGGASSGGGGSGYFSGGERGSVVQVISDAEVQAELALTDEQRQQVGDILGRVKAREGELFGDSRRFQQAQADRMRARGDERTKMYEAAHEQLSRATEKIIALLTPAQRAQLQVFCRQAKADEASFQAKMSPGQGGGRFSGGFGGGGGSSGGGSASPEPSATSSAGNSGAGRPGGVHAPIASAQGSGGGGSGGGGGGGGSTSPGSGMTWRKEHRGEYQSGGGPGGVVRVISYDSVQQQLRLSDGQRRQIAEITAQVGPFEAAFNADVRASRLGTAPEEYERRKQKEESTRQAVVRAGEEIIRLLQPLQQTRLKEICLQAQGPEALFKPEIIQALGLTATQQIKLATMRQEAERQVAALYQRRGKPSQPPPPIDLKSAADQSRAIQLDTEQRMIATVLTSPQQRKLKEMQGKEFAGVLRFRSVYAGGGGTASSSQQGKQP